MVSACSISGLGGGVAVSSQRCENILPNSTAFIFDSLCFQSFRSLDEGRATLSWWSMST